MTQPESLVLVVGDEEFLVARAVARAVRDTLAAVPDALVSDLDARTATAGEVGEALAPSLFGDHRVVVVRDIQDASREVAQAVTGFVSAPDPDVTLVVTHAGGAKGGAVRDVLAGAGARQVACPRVTRVAERREFVESEVRGAGGRIDADAVAGLIDALGTDLRELATAAAQLVEDVDARIDVAAVARYHRGRAGASGFDIADRAVEGDLAGALAALRWAVAAGEPPIKLLGALAANLRLVAQVGSAGRAAPLALAKRLGQPPWKVEKAMRWARAWTPDALSVAVRAVARADVELKGESADPGYALERTVATVAGQARSR